MPNGLGGPVDHRAEGTNVQRKLIWSLKTTVAAAKKKTNKNPNSVGLKQK